jgi:hypothetical protein
MKLREAKNTLKNLNYVIKHKESHGVGDISWPSSHEMT